MKTLLAQPMERTGEVLLIMYGSQQVKLGYQQRTWACTTDHTLHRSLYAWILKPEMLTNMQNEPKHIENWVMYSQEVCLIQDRIITGSCQAMTVTGSEHVNIFLISLH